MILCLEAMIWQTYYKRAPGLRFNVVKLTAWAVVVMGLFSILAVRLHYTLVRARTRGHFVLNLALRHSSSLTCQISHARTVRRTSFSPSTSRSPCGRRTIASRTTLPSVTTLA